MDADLEQAQEALACEQVVLKERISVRTRYLLKVLSTAALALGLILGAVLVLCVLNGAIHLVPRLLVSAVCAYLVSCTAVIWSEFGPSMASTMTNGFIIYHIFADFSVCAYRAHLNQTEFKSHWSMVAFVYGIDCQWFILSYLHLTGLVKRIRRGWSRGVHHLAEPTALVCANVCFIACHVYLFLALISG